MPKTPQACISALKSLNTLGIPPIARYNFCQTWYGVLLLGSIRALLAGRYYRIHYNSIQRRWKCDRVTGWEYILIYIRRVCKKRYVGKPATITARYFG